MTTGLKEGPRGSSGQLLDRLMVWSAVVLVFAIAAFAIYYYLDRPGAASPGLREQKTTQMEEAVRSDPDSYSARLGLAGAYESSHRYDEALEQYQVALQIAPQSAEATLGLARVKLAMGDVAGASASFQTLVELRQDAEFAPVDILLQEARYFLGEIYVGQGEYEAAIEQLTAAAAIDTTDADSWYMLCEAHFGAGNYDAAVENCDRALLMVPNFAEAYEVLAQAHQQLGQTLQARYASAMVLYSRDHHEDAVTELRTVVAEDPEFWRAYTGLGLALESSGQREEAIDAYEQALAGDPDSLLARMGVVRLGAPLPSDEIEQEEVGP